MKNYGNSWKDIVCNLMDDHVVKLSLARPDARNAISDDMIDSLESALSTIDKDPKIRVVILNGEGKSFCAGGDVKAMEERSGMFAGDSYELSENYKSGIQRIPRAIEKFSKPVIAMVNGAAIGAGCDLACMCDLRTGSSKSKFGETFSKLSLVPGDGGTFFLQRVVGYSKAMEMFLTGDIYNGEMAKDIGLINYLFSDENLESETLSLAKKIAENAPIAIKMTKSALKKAYLAQSMVDQLQYLAQCQGIAQRTEDHEEGLLALKEKRSPIFKGQ